MKKKGLKKSEDITFVKRRGTCIQKNFSEKGKFYMENHQTAYYREKENIGNYGKKQRGPWKNGQKGLQRPVSPPGV